jgi:methionine synthase II (cobalamin-independent)
VNPASFRVDHVGSLLRPAALKEKRLGLLGLRDADHNLDATNAELTKIEDGDTREVVKLQEDYGLPVVADGDFRRRSWWTDFLLSSKAGTNSSAGSTMRRRISILGNLASVRGAGSRRTSSGPHSRSTMNVAR